jgi:hypothetical protein
MGLEILLSVFPLALTYSAWRFQQKSHPPLSKIRRILFRCGLLMSVLCSLTVLSSWFDPFPPFRMATAATLISGTASFSRPDFPPRSATVGLAVFGRGPSRLLLTGSAVLLAFVAYAALLSNGV